MQTENLNYSTTRKTQHKMNIIFLLLFIFNNDTYTHCSQQYINFHGKCARYHKIAVETLRLNFPEENKKVPWEKKKNTKYHTIYDP